MKEYARNKRALFDYEILETFEAGLVLKGYEVKSIKTGHISLKGAYVTAKGAELFLTNATIPPYQHAGAMPTYDPTASRKLLVHKRELHYLIGRVRTEGLTLIPLTVYNKKRHIKVKFALGKGKKKYDKRQTIKKREDQRRMQKELKSY